MAATPPSEKNERLARRFPEEVTSEGNIDLIDEICTEEVLEHSPFGEHRGRDDLKDQSELIHAAFADVTVTIEEAVTGDDTVAHRLTFRGTHDGEFMGIEPAGNEVEIANMLFTRIEDGKIAERWLLPDTLTLIQQLGAIDLPGE